MKNNYKINRKSILDEKNKYYFLDKTAFKSEPTDVRRDIYLKTGQAFSIKTVRQVQYRQYRQYTQ